MDDAPKSMALRLEGSDALIAALDDQQELVNQRDELRRQLATFRLLYAELSLSQLEQMRVDLIIHEWEEVRVNTWRNPEGRLTRGTMVAWHKMRGAVL